MLLLKNLLQNKTYVLADQAFVSLLNFGSVFILSTLATISTFSDFVIAYSYSNLLFIFVTYFLSGPILVLFPKKDENESSAYLASLIVMGIILVTILSIIAYLFIKTQLKSISLLSFFGITLSMVFYDLLKKFLLAQNRVSFVFTTISSVILVILFFILVLSVQHNLDLNLILNIYMISFFTASILLTSVIGLYKFINFSSFIPSKHNINLMLQYFKEHFVYSKWIVAAGLLFWSYSQGIYIVADLFGVEDLGIAKVRSIQNLLGLFTILLVAMESYFLPIFSRNVKTLNHMVKGFYSKYGFIIIIIFLITIPIFILVYNEFYMVKFGSGWPILAIFWVSQLFVVLVRPLSMALKAKEVVYPLFIAHFFSLVSLIVVGLLAMLYFEDVGISIAIFLAYATSNFVIMYYYKKRIVI